MDGFKDPRLLSRFSLIPWTKPFLFSLSSSVSPWFLLFLILMYLIPRDRNY